MVSVIIPVYNSEKYLRRCLDSVMNQTYKDLDIIVVNDGSTDGSGVICDEYAAKDNRFHVIHQKNGGVSVARQTGLDAVRGEYFIFTDADDWVDLDMIDEMLSQATLNNADMVICDFYHESEFGWLYSNQQIPYYTSSREIIRMILKGFILGSCWNKFIKYSCCKGIRFTPEDLMVGEDELFIIRVLNKGITVVSLPKAFYYYFRNKGSIVNTYNQFAVESKIKEIKELEKILGDEIKEDCLDSQKKHTVRMTFLSNNLSLLPSVFPETHQDILSEGFSYHFKRPVAPCLFIALKGFPRTAFLLYKLNLYFLILAKKIKNFFLSSNQSNDHSHS